MSEREKIHVAVVNSVEWVCSNSPTVVSPERKQRLVEKIEERMRNGDPGDLAFVEETMFIKPNAAA